MNKSLFKITLFIIVTLTNMSCIEARYRTYVTNSTRYPIDFWTTYSGTTAHRGVNNLQPNQTDWVSDSGYSCDGLYGTAHSNKKGNMPIESINFNCGDVQGDAHFNAIETGVRLAGLAKTPTGYTGIPSEPTGYTFRLLD